MSAYYNEHDLNAAAWLRELIKDGLITDGEVDERSIEDVLPAELAGFDRCHFFAGVGVWDYALNLAGWTGQVWTGSCPCQPFSSAGKGEGFADERHLWPAWFHLIEVCRPNTVFGEQVASKDGLTWLDLVSADVEGVGYQIGAVDFPVAGVGAPHIRQRLFWVADSEHARHDRPEGIAAIARRDEPGERLLVGDRDTQRLADTTSGHSETERLQRSGEHGLLAEGDKSRGVVNTELPEGERQRQHGGEVLRVEEPDGPSGASSTNGFWSDTEWVHCNDPKSPRWRPTKPGIFPLADRTPGRVALLRGAGNAISPWVAKAFIESVKEL